METFLGHNFALREGEHEGSNSGVALPTGFAKPRWWKSGKQRTGNPQDPLE